MCSVTWIEITGTRYSHGNVVVIDTDLVPVFSIIEDIIVDELMCYYFVLEKLHTVINQNIKSYIPLLCSAPRSE